MLKLNWGYNVLGQLLGAPVVEDQSKRRLTPRRENAEITDERSSRATEMDQYPQLEDPDESEPFIPEESYTEDKSPHSNISEENELPLVPLPPKSPVLRFTRWTIFGVYRRIFLCVVLLNIWQGHRIITMKRRSKYSPLLVDMSTAAAANMFLAILMRQDYVLNLLFKITWCVPFRAPLRLRRSLAKIYEYGGLHSGAAFCSVIWWTLLSLILVHEYWTIRIADPLIMLCTFIVVGISWAMLITAYPTMRASRHNTFEVIHRFGGWAVLALFWPELWLFTRKY